MLGFALAAAWAAGSAGAAPGLRLPGLQLPGLQLPGMFHAGEAVARDGERWLALVDGMGGVRLREVRVSVVPAHDPLVDDTGGRSGRIVESAPGVGGGVVAYLRGPGLRERPVIRATVEALSRQDGLPVSRLRLGGRDYRLDTHCEADPAIHDGYRCALRLSEGQRHQALATMAATREPGIDGFILDDEASPHLIFAGDLDGDGALDLLYDRSDHGNVAVSTLFLSGVAGVGELARPVAEQPATGC